MGSTAVSVSYAFTSTELTVPLFVGIVSGLCLVFLLTLAYLVGAFETNRAQECQSLALSVSLPLLLIFITTLIIEGAKFVSLPF